MKEIYIIGASGLAREVATYILDLHPLHEITGFIDRKTDEHQTIRIRSQEYNVIDEDRFLSQIQSKGQQPDVVIAVGNPAIRASIADKYAKLCSFPNIIHPSVIMLDDNINLGKGNLFAPDCIIHTNVTVGNFNYFNCGVSLGHDAYIGNYNLLNSKVSISGIVHVGDKNLIGANGSVLQGIKVGNNNIIGMGSALINDISNNNTLIGVPARIIFKKDSL
jgi:sugar O-acyltransferase (sialic acid O-acetyltransferase NeuD family)